ncbi:hypothetical protein PHMEG_00011814 [Phytophthora megakarya]|uniref:Uncharacterized protein n=1 Tax=Phytophthora megakarya TaxID=4795 RepID=A0A225WCW8_9STRA|nr:hypothetical protein PHMEG_00011814 [Phytophthora megakarya]
MREADNGRGTLNTWVRQRARDVNGWMDWILTAENINDTFHISELLRAQRDFVYYLASVKTPQLGAPLLMFYDTFLMLCYSYATLAVEEKIKAEMPDQFGAIIDGWSHASEHFLAVFACYEVDGTTRSPS